MNTYLAIAAALAVFNTGLHIFAGGKTIAKPLLAAKTLTDQVRCVLYFCWHIATLALLLQAILFTIAAIVPTENRIALVGTTLAAAIGLLGIAMPPFLGVSYKTMPQGWLFVPVAALGIVGLF